MNWSVLVVDDEPLTQNLLRMMLEPVGFDVFGAEDGYKALSMVENNCPDVLILDVMMPDLDGIEVCKKIRSQPQTENLPIVMLSGKTHLNAAEDGLRAGADKYLFKPMSRSDLINSLRDVLRKRHAVSA
ncbi:MAG: response regulator [Chloroflexi bacterium]|nr:response regulator [Chloroflexota bacterium]